LQDIKITAILYKGGTPMKIHKLVILLMLVSLIFVSNASAGDGSKLEKIEDRFADLGYDDDRMDVMNIMMTQQDVDVVKIDIDTTATTAVSSFLSKFRPNPSSSKINVVSSSAPTTYYVIKGDSVATIITTEPDSGTYTTMWTVGATIKETESIIDVLDAICDKELTKSMMKDCILLYRSVEITGDSGIRAILINFIVN